MTADNSYNAHSKLKKDFLGYQTKVFFWWMMKSIYNCLIILYNKVRIESGFMREKEINRVFVIATFVIFAIAMVFVTYYIVNVKNGNSKYFQKYNRVEKNELSTVLTKQNAMNKRIKEEIEKGEYTAEKPLIIKNPYEINPLSALIIFKTAESIAYDVYINDQYVYKTEENPNHIIPIYGLYANANNVVALKNGLQQYEYEISTNPYNDETYDLDIASHLGDKTHYFLLGNQLDKESNLRGFDHNANLVFSIELTSLSSMRTYNDRFYVSYNGKYSENIMPNITLEIDYLGHILSISLLDDLEKNANLTLGNGKYIGTAVSIYQEMVPNYNPVDTIDQVGYTEASKVLTKDIEEELDHAKIYEKDFLLSSNGEYITYHIEDKAILALVGRNDEYTKLIPVSGSGILKAEIKAGLSLYLIIDNEYYSLMTTITK